MTRAVVCVATTGHYQKGMRRLMHALPDAERTTSRFWDVEPIAFENGTPCPKHSEVPYAFKAFALMRQWVEEGVDLLLWCDASILPIRSLEPLWERIEREGYWFSLNGFTNYEWTADSAYPDLFPQGWLGSGVTLEDARATNKKIPHVVATSFGLNVKHPIGKAFLDEYYRLASETKAFCGPWINRNATLQPRRAEPWRYGVCGPADVRGHRHDQACASVIAWRLGMKFTAAPDIFAYSKRRDDGTLHLEDQDERTILLADGQMEDGVVL